MLPFNCSVKPEAVNVSKRARNDEKTQKHMDHSPEKGFLSDFHYGLLHLSHEPIATERRDEHPRCQGHSRWETGKVGTSTGMGLQESQTRVRHGSTSEK